MRARPIFLALSSLMLAACSNTVWLPWSPFGVSCPVTVAGGASAVVIGGQLRAPMSLLDPKNRDVREVPVPGSDVALADAKSQPLPGVHAKSGSDGSFALSRTLTGYAYVVVARVKTSDGRTVTMRSLAMPGTSGATSDVNIATTVLTTALLDGLTGMPGSFDTAQYAQAVALVYQHLGTDGSPDPADNAAVLARVAAWSATDSVLKGLIDALRKQLGASQPSLDDLVGKIATLDHQSAPGAGHATPAPSTGPSPSPTDAAPSAAPSGTPDLVKDVLPGSPLPAESAPADVAPSTQYVPGYLDGPLRAARFNGMAGIAADGARAVYVADANNNRIRKVDFTDAANPVVTTLAGNGTPGSSDGPGLGATFNTPYDLTYDGAGHLYVAEYRGHRIRRIDLTAPDLTVTTIAGRLVGHQDGPGTSAEFDTPVAIAFDRLNSRLFVAEASGAVIRAVDVVAPYNVTTVAGRYRQAGYLDGPAVDARFNAPQGLAMGPANDLFISDTVNNVIRRLTFDLGGKALAVETIAGQAPSAAATAGTASATFVDGPASDARFKEPVGLAFAANGDLLVADPLNRRIRKIGLSHPPAMVSTVAGPTQADLSGQTAALAFPSHLTTDATGSSLFSDLRIGLLLRVP